MIDKKQLKKLNGQMFRDVVLFDADNPSGRIIGRGIRINIVNKKEVVIIDNDGNEMLRKDSSVLSLYFHQGWGGINIVCNENPGDSFTLTLHYIDHIKK